MTFSPALKLVLGVAAVAPAIGMALVFGSGALPTGAEMEQQGFGAFMEAWGREAGEVSVISFVAMVAFVFLALRSERIPRERRWIWVVLLLLGGPVAFLAFWWLYVWEDGPPLPGWRA
jgi:hypothetical protein